MAAFDIPLSLRNTIITDIEMGRVIDEGVHGRILEAKWEGSVVAVKQIHPIFEEINAQEFEALKNKFLVEFDRNIRLRHPNIVRFIGICFPPRAKIPNLVMERFHCSLNDLLKENPVIHLDIKMSILHQIGLGLRYLHTRVPPIVHCNLSSKNILISKSIEAKISSFAVNRLVDHNRKLISNRCDFLPSEILINDPYMKESDVFSFGCVMLHTLTQQWPTPSQYVVTDSVECKLIAQSEIERRAEYLDKVPKVLEDIMVPLIVGCLEDVPADRPTIMEVCDQLETLVVNREQSIPDNLLQAQLMLQEAQSEVERQVTELRDKDVEMEALRSDMSKMQVVAPHLLPKQVNKSSSDFWNSLKVTWQQCASPRRKCWPISASELNGKVYVSGYSGIAGPYSFPFMYDSDTNQWFRLPSLPCWYFSLVTVTERKQLLAIGGTIDNNGITEPSNRVFLWDENDRRWLTSYPNMPTARFGCSSISHGLTVIVAGGVTCVVNPSIDTITRAVEVLHINDNGSYWSAVKQLPHIVHDAIPVIVDDKLYLAQGFDAFPGCSTCNVVTASLPELLQSSNNTSSSQVWSKLPDMPYSSYSINHYQGHLIIFTGDRKVERPDEDNPLYELVPLIHIYNPDTTTWDCVGSVPMQYVLGLSVHLKENKLLFIGGLTGTHEPDIPDDIVSTCQILTLTPQ